MTDAFAPLFQTMITAVETEMRSVLQLNGDSADLFAGMMHYHMGWVDASLRPVHIHSGKRIRPLLCLLSCQAAGGSWEQAVPAAASIEILHNFTLIHDDIQDNSPTRRGRPTLWTLWGVPQAINSGDAMFAAAHLAMARLLENGAPPATVVQALRRLDETCMDLTRGQFADMQFETRENVTVDEYLAMIQGKTAVLIALCAELGALIAQRDAQTIHHYAAFALHLGLAFQVRDDILGIWGQEDVIGKSAATDIVTRKKSLPVLFGLAQSADLRQLYATAGNGEAFVTQAIALLNESGARHYAETQERKYTDTALQHLQAAGIHDQSAAPLYHLVRQLLGRIS